MRRLSPRSIKGEGEVTGQTIQEVVQRINLPPRFQASVWYTAGTEILFVLMQLDQPNVDDPVGKEVSKTRLLSGTQAKTSVQRSHRMSLTEFMQSGPEDSSVETKVLLVLFDMYLKMAQHEWEEWVQIDGKFVSDPHHVGRLLYHDAA